MILLSPFGAGAVAHLEIEVGLFETRTSHGFRSGLLASRPNINTVGGLFNRLDLSLVSDGRRRLGSGG